MDKLGALGGAAVLTGSLLGGADLSPFMDDRFESISGTLNVASGVARTDDFRLQHRL